MVSTEPAAGQTADAWQRALYNVPRVGGVVHNGALRFASSTSASGLGRVKTRLAEALTPRDFGEVAVLGHLAEFGGFSVWKGS